MVYIKRVVVRIIFLVLAINIIVGIAFMMAPEESRVYHGTFVRGVDTSRYLY